MHIKFEFFLDRSAYDPPLFVSNKTFSMLERVRFHLIGYVFDLDTNSLGFYCGVVVFGIDYYSIKI